jgi:hypothetical protein
MRVADNESLRPSRALPPSTLPPRLEASLGQRGQTMVQVTISAGPANKALRLRLGAGPLAVRLPPEQTGSRKRRTQCTP